MVALLLPPENIAPKRRISITGKMSVKNSPILLLVYSFVNTDRSASILLTLNKTHAPSVALLSSPTILTKISSRLSRFVARALHSIPDSSIAPKAIRASLF